MRPMPMNPSNLSSGVIVFIFLYTWNLFFDITPEQVVAAICRHLVVPLAAEPVSIHRESAIHFPTSREIKYRKQISGFSAKYYGQLLTGNRIACLAPVHNTCGLSGLL